MNKTLLLLVFIWSCESKIPDITPNNTISGSDNRTPATTDNNIAAPADTSKTSFSTVYDFLNSGEYGVRANSIDQFSSSWYAYVRGDAYKGFQQFGVVFPFEYTVEDTAGAATTLNFYSVGEMAQWRLKQDPGLYAWELAHFGAPDRVVWEGYPDEVYGAGKHENFPNTSDSTAVVLTYLFPGNQVAYFFRHEAGIWRVYKRFQKKYSRQEMTENSTGSFDGFLLRFISDKSFRLSSIKWPLKRVDMPAEGEPVTTTFLKQAKYHHQNTWQGTSLMNLRHGLSPERVSMDTMYLHSKAEGGVNFGSVFVKKNKRYVLTEIWDASN